MAVRLIGLLLLFASLYGAFICIRSKEAVVGRDMFRALPFAVAGSILGAGNLLLHRWAAALSAVGFSALMALTLYCAFLEGGPPIWATLVSLCLLAAPLYVLIRSLSSSRDQAGAHGRHCSHSERKIRSPLRITLRGGEVVPEKVLLLVEAELGCELSDSFRSFVRSRSGTEPEPNIFKVSEMNESGVNRFIPCTDILKERVRIPEIPEKAYPIAWAEGGNYVFIDESRGGRVFFWDHEQPYATFELAANFDDFLNLLQPFDPKSIQLNPGHVTKAWIDPDFLKRFKK